MVGKLIGDNTERLRNFLERHAEIPLDESGIALICRELRSILSKPVSDQILLASALRLRKHWHYFLHQQVTFHLDHQNYEQALKLLQPALELEPFDSELAHDYEAARQGYITANLAEVKAWTEAGKTRLAANHLQSLLAEHPFALDVFILHFFN